MYISNVQWRGSILSDLHDAIWVAWGCYRGCPECTTASGSGWVALSILRDKHSSGAWECGLVDLLRAAVPDGLSLPHLHLNIFVWFYTYIFEYSCNTRIPVHGSCGPAVVDQCRTGVSLTLQASGWFRPGCDVLRHAHWDMEENDGTLWTALVDGISGVTSCWWWCLC